MNETEFAVAIFRYERKFLRFYEFQKLPMVEN